LVVDAANVVGSRPDGWWRDRAGAANRLHARLVGADLATDVVLVVEGAARRGPAEGTEGRVTTVHAAGSGDDAIVDVVRGLVEDGDHTVVVTADRGLRHRVVEWGANVEGPSWLLQQLP
jgi:hypothetical protein